MAREMGGAELERREAAAVARLRLEMQAWFGPRGLPALAAEVTQFCDAVGARVIASDCASAAALPSIEAQRATLVAAMEHYWMQPFICAALCPDQAEDTDPGVVALEAAVVRRWMDALPDWFGRVGLPALLQAQQQLLAFHAEQLGSASAHGLDPTQARADAARTLGALIDLLSDPMLGHAGTADPQCLDAASRIPQIRVHLDRYVAERLQRQEQAGLVY